MMSVDCWPGKKKNIDFAVRQRGAYEDHKFKVFWRSSKKRRKQLGYTQKYISEFMGVRQETILKVFYQKVFQEQQLLIGLKWMRRII